MADIGEREEGRKLPEELAGREKLKGELVKARDRLEKEAKAEAEREQTDYECKLQAREWCQGKAKGKRPKPPDDTPPPNKQSNLTDPDSALMCKNKGGEYRQSYNAQAVVGTDGSELAVGNRISQSASDRNDLCTDVASVPGELGRVSSVLADNGYANGTEVDALERESIEVLVATGRGEMCQYDFCPPKLRRIHRPTHNRGSNG